MRTTLKEWKDWIATQDFYKKSAPTSRERVVNNMLMKKSPKTIFRNWVDEIYMFSAIYSLCWLLTKSSRETVEKIYATDFDELLSKHDCIDDQQLTFCASILWDFGELDCFIDIVQITRAFFLGDEKPIRKFLELIDPILIEIAKENAVEAIESYIQLCFWTDENFNFMAEKQEIFLDPSNLNPDILKKSIPRKFWEVKGAIGFKAGSVIIGLIQLYLERDPVAFVKCFIGAFYETAIKTPVGMTSELFGQNENISHAFCNVSKTIPLMGKTVCCDFDGNGERGWGEIAFSRMPLTPAWIISHAAKYPVYSDIPYSTKLEKLFLDSGCDETSAHDYTVIAGVFYLCGCRELSVSNNSGSSDSDLVKTNEELREQIEKSKRIAAKQDRRIAVLEKENAQLQKALKTAEYEAKKARGSSGDSEQIAVLKEENQTLMDTIEELTGMLESSGEGTEEPVPDIQLPFYTNRKIVLYGGYDQFHSRISKLIPNIKIIPPTDSIIDTNPIRNADLVCVQINRCGHPQYWTAITAAKNSNRPIVHLKFANPERCARIIAEKVRELDGGEQNA